MKRTGLLGAGEPARAAFPGAQGKVFFGQDDDIWSMNANGSGQRNLTNTAGPEEHDPAFSPAGGKLAYTRTSSIWVINPDGSDQTNLTPEDNISDCPNQLGYYFNGASKHPAFSPNGSRIVFESNRDGVGRPTELYSMPADGTGITRLTTNGLWDPDADWAPLDTTTPRVIAVAPAASATDVLPGANVSAAFSEAMRANTLTRTTVRLVRRDTGALVSATVVYNPDTMRVVLNPASNLSAGESYTATITTGAGDAAGNALPANKTWSFKIR